MGYSGGNAISVNCWDPPGTNCPDPQLTNSYRPIPPPAGREEHSKGASAQDKHCVLVLPDIIACLNELAGEAGKSV